MAGKVGRCGVLGAIGLASVALATPPSASAVHGAFPGVPVDVAFSGSEDVNYTESYWDGDGCGGTTTGGGQVTQTLRWDLKTPHATIYNRKAVFAAFFNGERVNGTRQVVEDHHQKAHGPCSDTPGLVESGPGTDYDHWFRSGGCGTERYKVDMDVANTRSKPRFVYAEGWHADDAGAFRNCGTNLYDWHNLRPRPWAGPGDAPAKLDAVRDGRRKRATFEFQNTYEEHYRDESSGYDPADNYGTVYEQTAQITIHWRATVTRAD